MSHVSNAMLASVVTAASVVGTLILAGPAAGADRGPDGAPAIGEVEAECDIASRNGQVVNAAGPSVEVDVTASTITITTWKSRVRRYPITSDQVVVRLGAGDHRATLDRGGPHTTICAVGGAVAVEGTLGRSLFVVADGRIDADLDGDAQWVHLVGMSDVRARVAAPTLLFAGGEVDARLGKHDDVVLSVGGGIVETGDGNDDIRSIGPVDIDAGGGDDTVSLVPWFAPLASPQLAGSRTVDAGPGHDVIQGSDFADVLAGGPGDDLIRSGDGPDQVDGGDDHDICDPAPQSPPSTGDRYTNCEIAQSSTPMLDGPPLLMPVPEPEPVPMPA